MRLKPQLVEADAIRICNAARKYAQANGWAVTIAIVDDGGALLRLERMDGTGFVSSDIAAGKARMAALSRRPTKEWEERIAERPAFLKFLHGLPIQGGIPVRHNEWCVGGIGVSGVQSHQDEQIALAGLDGLSLEID